jgi:hypothetical protein
MVTSMSTLPALVGSPASTPAQRPARPRRSAGVVGAGSQRGRQPQSRGRPSRLKPELAERLVGIVAQVGFLSTAARVCGLPPALVCEWVARGLGRDPDRPSTPVYAEFADAIERARAEYELRCLLRIDAAAQATPHNWRAAAWQLERFAPERYGGRRFVNTARAMTAQAVEALLGAAVDLVGRSVPPDRRETEIANLIAAADEIVGGIRDRPVDG